MLILAMLSLGGKFVPPFLSAVSLSFIRTILVPFCVFPSLGKGCRVHHYSGIPQWVSTRPDCNRLTRSSFLQPASVGPCFAGHPLGGGKQSQKGALPDYSFSNPSYVACVRVRPTPLAWDPPSILDGSIFPMKVLLGYIVLRGFGVGSTIYLGWINLPYEGAPGIHCASRLWRGIHHLSWMDQSSL